MFNFKTLKLDKREDPKSEDPFVGIRRNQETHELEFRLPRGFQDFPDSDFELTKRFFFGMYRTFKKFEQDQKGKKNVINKQDDNKNSPKDNIEKKGDAYQFTDKEDNDVLLYSKISMIDNLLDVYNDLSLDMIERRIGRNEEVDYSKLDQYLDKATYLPNDVIYIDEMDLPRQTFQRDATSLIDLFCFIVSELKSELEQNECIDTHVEDLSKRFKAQHLNHDQSLFNEETFEITLVILKDILNKINQTTVYKDEEYWQLYEAIEMFLYGELDMQNTDEDGIFWGISQFYQVWEDMCNTYLLFNSNMPESKIDVIYADTKIKIKGKNIANGFDNPFFIEFREEKKWMKPDIIYLKNSKLQVNGIPDIGITKQKEEKIKIPKELKQPASYYSIEKPKKEGVINFSESSINSLINLFGIIFTREQEEEIKKFKELKRHVPYYFAAQSIKKEKFNHLKSGLTYKIKHIINSFEKKENIKKCYLVDWKYLDESFFIKKQKEETYLIKQICYEAILKASKPDFTIINKFIIPYFSGKEIDNKVDIFKFEQVDDKKLYSRISKNGIKLFKADFMKIQHTYLKS